MSSLITSSLIIVRKAAIQVWPKTGLHNVFLCHLELQTFENGPDFGFSCIIIGTRPGRLNSL